MKPLSLRRAVLAAATAGTLLTLAACGDDDTAAAASRTGASVASTSPAEEGSSGGEWQSDVVPDGDPVAAGDYVIALSGEDDVQGEPPTDLVGVDATSGKQVWKTALPIAAGSTMVFDHRQGMSLTQERKPVFLSGGVATDGTPVVVAEYQVQTKTVGLDQGGTVTHLVAFDAKTGKQKWDETAPKEPMLFTGGPKQSVVLFGAITPPENSLQQIPISAVDLGTGKQVWSYDGEALPYAVTGTDLVMVDQDLDRSAIFALDVNTGEQEWKTPDWVHVNAQNWLDYDVARVGNGMVLAWKDWDPDPNTDHAYTALLIDAHTGETIGQIATDQALKSGVPTDNEFDRTQAFARPNDQGMVQPSQKGVVDSDRRAAYFLDGAGGAGSYRLVALGTGGSWTVDVPGTSSTEVLSAGNGHVVLRNNGLVTLDATTGKQVGNVAPDPHPEAEVGTDDGGEDPGVVLQAGGYSVYSNNGALQGVPNAK